MPLFIIIALVALPFSIVLIGLAREYMTVRAEFISVCDEMGVLSYRLDDALESLDVERHLYELACESAGIWQEKFWTTHREFVDLRAERNAMAVEIDYLRSLLATDTEITIVRGGSGLGTHRSMPAFIEISMEDRAVVARPNRKARYKK